MIIIGIVGVPAGGKSTVAAELAALGATWINADRIAHQVLQSPEVVAGVVDFFGPEMVDENGKIDRRQLGNRVFGDDDRSARGLRYLESVIHPPTRRIINEQLAAADAANVPAVVLDIPLLFENGWANQCDEVWFIDTAPAIQLAAAQRRGWSAEALQSRQSRQMPSEEKRRLSTRIIPNHESLQALTSRVKKLWDDCVNASAIERPQSSTENHCHPIRPRDH